MTIDWPARCDALVADSERELTAAVGDSSLCAISRQGDRVDGVKYLEGRAAALRDLRRALRTAPGDVAHRAELRTWQDQLRLARDRAMGPDWIAYRSGGVDALIDIASLDAEQRPSGR